MSWDWLQRNAGLIASLLGQHAILALAPVLVALVISLPLGFAVYRTGRGAKVILAVLGVISSIPALALLVVVPLLLGTSILSRVNVAVALTVYSVALLIRSVVEGLRSVPDRVRQSARAAGLGRSRRLLRIELPLAMPVIFAGLRRVTVSNIALVTVAALVASGGLGTLLQLGYTSRFYTPLIAGLVLTVLLALVADAALRLIQRGTLPWTRARRA
ncbi:ABC transporter permease [uncultured Friedmanniella sp.]|uniref:ABC transporter permease n=1 Tax=uncultured Friedmanniella sp. TaxID=335381 RepID=UPI0035C9C1E9